MPAPLQLQRKLPLIIAIICGVAAVFLFNIYLQRREGEIINKVKQVQQRVAQQPPPVQKGIVLVAKNEISAQAPITPDDLEIKEVPVEYIQPGAVTVIGEVIGQISSGPIVPGEQILKTKLLPANKVVKTLSEITPEGKRAVTVSVDNLSNVAGFLRPGDSVDILALVALPKESTPRLISLFQGVQVLAMGDELVGSVAVKSKGSSATTPQTVTFALTPQEAALLSFVQEHGKIRLALRSAQDSNLEPVEPVDWDTLLKYLSSSAAGKAGSGTQPLVEIYRGSQKEIVPLSYKEKK